MKRAKLISDKKKQGMCVYTSRHACVHEVPYFITMIIYCVSLAVEPRINTEAAKRFVRNALWEAEEHEKAAGQTPGREQMVDSQNGGESSSRKRKTNSDQDNPGSSKRTRL